MLLMFHVSRDTYHLDGDGRGEGEGEEPGDDDDDARASRRAQVLSLHRETNHEKPEIKVEWQK